MKWWMKDRRVVLQILLLLLCYALVVIVGSLSLSVPGIFGGTNWVPVTMVGPLPLVVFHASRALPPYPQEQNGVRSTRRLDLALAGALCLAGVILGIALIPLVGTLGLVTTRTLIGILAIALIVGGSFGQRAAAVAPVLTIVVVSLAGTSAATLTPFWWAFPIAPAQALPADLLVLTLAVAATGVAGARQK